MRETAGENEQTSPTRRRIEAHRHHRNAVRILRLYNPAQRRTKSREGLRELRVHPIYGVCSLRKRRRRHQCSYHVRPCLGDNVHEGEIIVSMYFNEDKYYSTVSYRPIIFFTAVACRVPCPLVRAAQCLVAPEAQGFAASSPG